MKYDPKYKPPFRVGRKQKKAVLDAKGMEVIFFKDSELQAQLYCNYLNESCNEFNINYEDRVKWFSERVGKRVYRNKTSCNCVTCNKVYEEGLIVDYTNGSYYAEIECLSFKEEGNTPMMYFDTKQEALEFDKKLNNK